MPLKTAVDRFASAVPSLASYNLASVYRTTYNWHEEEIKKHVRYLLSLGSKIPNRELDIVVSQKLRINSN